AGCKQYLSAIGNEYSLTIAHVLWQVDRILLTGLGIVSNPQFLPLIVIRCFDGNQPFAVGSHDGQCKITAANFDRLRMRFEFPDAGIGSLGDGKHYYITRSGELRRAERSV